jgi:hypothetical protein
MLRNYHTSAEQGSWKAVEICPFGNVDRDQFAHTGHQNLDRLFPGYYLFETVTRLRSPCWSQKMKEQTYKSNIFAPAKGQFSSFTSPKTLTKRLLFQLRQPGTLTELEICRRCRLHNAVISAVLPIV